MSDTPRTDAALRVHTAGKYWVTYEHARQLERELAQACIDLRAVTIQRDETWAELQKCRERLQTVTFGSNPALRSK
jgi:hypothetical protein